MKTQRISINSFNDLMDITINPVFDKSNKQLVIVFGPADTMFKEISQKIKEFLPNAKIAGLGSSQSFVDSKTTSFSVAIIEFSDSNFELITQKNSTYEESEKTGQILLSRMKELSTKEMPIAGVMILSEGLKINGAALVRPFEDEKIPVSGGLASEIDFAFKKTNVFLEDNEVSEIVVAICFYGNNFSMKMSHSTGMRSFGIRKKVTKSIGNVLFEVDSKPAIEWYSQYLKEKISESFNALTYPIGIYRNDSELEGAIRTPIGFNSDGSIVFTGEIKENYQISMMMASPIELVSGAEKLVESNKDNEFSIYFSCSARQMLLGHISELEYSSGKNCIGAYVYGEISSVDGKPALVNQTFTSVSIKG